MSVKIAFRKNDKRLLSRFIQWWTDSPYSHCEIVVDEWCYSSSAMDKGVRRKKIDLDSDSWDVLELTWVDGNSVKNYFYKTSDNSYGYLLLITSQFLNLGKDSEESQFCSMWCANALGIPNASQESPKTLYELCLWLNSKIK